MYQQYTDPFKLKLVNLYTTGTTISILCNRQSVPRSTIYSWIHRYKKIKVGKTHLVSARELYLLRKRLNTITAENNIYKESNCNKISSLDDKISAIKKLDGKYSIHSLCRVLGVRRSTYYHRKFRSPKQTIIEKQNALLMPEIKTIFEETKGRLGARKINVLLAQKGVRTSAGRVSKLMKELNLERVYKKI